MNFENNSIITITSLNICIKLKVLKLANNQIKYLNSTLRIFKNLKNLEEITIKNNPFLSELTSYREYFISNYKNIQKFDDEIITEETRKIAESFYKENNPVYRNITERPMSSRPGIKRGDESKNNENNGLYDLFEEDLEKSSDDDLNNVMMAKTQIDFRTMDKINITENKNINKKNEDNTDNKKNINDEKLKNEEEEKLKKIIDKQKIIIDKLKNELEFTSKINKDYEMKIDEYNIELNYYNNDDNINNEEEDEETKNIRKELEMWKKQYFNLLEKNVNKEDNNMKFSKDLFNKNKKRENKQIKKDIIERPQTAQVRSNLTRDFKKLYEEINVLEGKNTKNVFEEVLNEESDEDDEEEENKDEKENEEEKEEEEKDIKEGNEIEDEIPDDEIEEMFRKSYQDIQKMRKDLQEINKNMDNDSNLNKKNNIENILNEDRKGSKPSLKPIIYKKDDTSSYIITNNHVIASSDSIKIMLANSEVLDVELVGKDVFSDIAVLKTNNTNVKVSKIGNSTNLELGDTVFTVGSPLGINFQGTITKGIISGLDRTIEVELSIGSSLMDVIQTDAAINEGNSGGPLCNIKGEVIGINSLKITGEDAEGMGFAIPIENALEVANKLEIEGHIDRPSIGVSLTDTDNAILTDIGINVPNIDYGAVITNIKTDSSAYEAGLRKGDVITKINNIEVKSASHFRYLLYKNNINDEITIEYMRNSNISETKLVLTEILAIKD